MARIRRMLISGNWKMNHNHLEALHTVEKLHFRLSKDDFIHTDVSVHPPFTDIRSVQTYLAGEKKALLLLGAQNCHPDEKGAFTGEVSVSMLAKLECRLVIVGHSERRQIFGETDEFVNAKVKAVLKRKAAAKAKPWWVMAWCKWMAKSNCAKPRKSEAAKP